MPSPEDISKAFNKFAGREVPVLENIAMPKKAGQPPKRYMVPRSNDPVLKEMFREAKKLGFRLFVQWPGHEKPPKMKITAGKLPEPRLIARLEKGADGKWRVGSTFKIGR
jgi:hypothetical protein